MIICGNVLNEETWRWIPDKSISCCVTSPPYWNLRDYNVEGQIGIGSLEGYIKDLVTVFSFVREKLKDDGTVWLNLGDCYSAHGPGGSGKHADWVKGINRKSLSIPGLPPKNLVGVPWKVAFALQDDGWYLRSDIIWAKSNPMPEPVRDRPTRSHEYVFLLSKSSKYYYNCEAIKEPLLSVGIKERVFGESNKAKGYNRRQYSGNTYSDSGRTGKNKRDVWVIGTQNNKEAHFATFPTKLVEPCVLAGSKEGGIVLDPFFGSGTTGVVCKSLKREYIGIDLNRDYCRMACKRLETLFLVREGVR